MKEIEIKIPLSSSQVKDVKNRLKREGYQLVRYVKEVDIYFNAPHRDFTRTDEALRVRRTFTISSQSETLSSQEVTYKGPKYRTTMKIRDEITVKIDDSYKFSNLLKSLGFIEVFIVVKKRKYYRYGDFLVSLDHVENLGYFMEVEIQVENSEQLESSRRQVLDIAKSLLQCSVINDERRSYLELLLEKH